MEHNWQAKMNTTILYEWILKHLITILENEERNSAQTDSTTIINAAPGHHVHSVDGETVITRRQSNLQARPRTQGTVLNVDGEDWTLGDGARFRPPLLLQANPGAIVTRRLPPWLPPWPVMLPQTKGTSVAWDGPDHAAHVHFMADDGLFDHPGYVRDDGAFFCGAVMGVPVEISGVFVDPKLRRCNADWRTFPEHFSLNERYNLRLPVMAGVDNDGPYLRVIGMPLKTFEYRDLYDSGNAGGGGIPT